MKTFRALAFASLTLLLLALSARAANMTVTTTNDELDASSADGTGISLREAIRDLVALSGEGTITFAPSINGQEIDLKPPSDPKGGPLLKGDLFPASGLVIDATSLPNGVIIDGQKATTFFASDQTDLTLRGLTFKHGVALPGADANLNVAPIAITRASLTVEFCTFIDNEEFANAQKVKVPTARRAGVIFFTLANAPRALSITGSTFVNNRVGRTTVQSGGGAISVSNVYGDVTITNSTFTKNDGGSAETAGQKNAGGAILLDQFSGTFIMSHCTLTENKVTKGSGGGIFGRDSTRVNPSGTATIILENSIFFGNRAGGGGDVVFVETTVGPVTPDVNIQGVCIIPEITNGRTNGVVGGLVLKNVDPKLQPLGDYGGRTQTMALKPGSPAIDAAPQPFGALLLADQIGNPRKRGPRWDIGAVEYAPFSLNGLGVMVTTTADESDFDISQGAGISLREAIREAPSGAVITFDPALGPTPTITLDPALGPLRPRSAVSYTIDAGNFTPTATNAGVTIDGAGQTQLWQIDPSVKLTLKRFTLKGGNGRQSNVGNFVGGGAIANGGNLTLTECSVEGNSSITRGGGIENTGKLLAERCTFMNNTANASPPPHDIGGGGALINLGEALLGNCTLTANTAFYGGAIDQIEITGAALPKLDVYHCTIAGNTAMELDGGGGIFSLYDWELEQSIVAGNTALALPNDVVNSNGFAFQDSGLTLKNKNIVPKFFNVNGGKIGGKEQADGLLATGANKNILDNDPKLGALGFLGGPTSTIPLQAGSPAIDAASFDAGTDQRGFAITGDPDLGAFEFGAFGTGQFQATLSDTTPPMAPGLDAPLAAPIVITSGDSELSLTVNSDGSFKGTLLIAGGKYIFTGQFAEARTATVQLTGKNLPALTLTLTLSGPQDNNLDATIAGAGITGGTDTAAGELASGKKYLAPPEVVGRYTGYFTDTALRAVVAFEITKNGAVRLVGILCDGTKFTYGTRLSGTTNDVDLGFSGRVPLYKKQGFFQFALISRIGGTFTGKVRIFRPPGVKAPAPASLAGEFDFTFTDPLFMPIARYIPAPKGVPAIVGFADRPGMLALQVVRPDPLEVVGSFPFVLSPAGKGTSATVGLKIKAFPKTGIVMGTHPNPTTGGKPLTFFGAAFQADPLVQGVAFSRDADRHYEVDIFPN